MSTYGKYNLVAMLAVPLFAMVASVIVFGVRLDTQIFVFITNAIPMLIGGAVSGLLLRAANRTGKSRTVALWPILVPAAAGLLWYLILLLSSGSDDGREFFAGPFYLLAGAVLMSVIAAIASLFAKPQTG
jgi:hypothetical protein